MISKQTKTTCIQKGIHKPAPGLFRPINLADGQKVTRQHCFGASESVG